MKAPGEPGGTSDVLPPRVFAAGFGIVLGVALLKFGSPPIMEKFTTPPADVWEFIFGCPWPIAWAYLLLGAVSVVGLLAARWKWAQPRWLAVLPLAWLAWQILAATATVDSGLSWPTVKHFTACVLCFYLGFFVLRRVRPMWPFWAGLLCAFAGVLAIGCDQHFRGLDETRRFFYLYIYPRMKDLPPELLKKMSSNRIFSTLFYPNALAGALLLLTPIMLGLVGLARKRLTPGARAFLIAVVGIAVLGCLYWSGSKGGWLLMLLLGLIALLRFPFAKWCKILLVCIVIVLGLSGFFWRYAAFFKKGATSVSARFDYWRAAIQVTRAHPWLGTGPGTFLIPY